MYKRKSIALFLGFLMIFSSITVFAAEHTDDHRIAGDNRYQTAYEVAMEKYDSADTVIVVRGDDENGEPQVVDALSASGLAGVEGAPIFLTRKGVLHAATVKGINDLGAKNVIIVGGPQAVSTAVEDELKAMVDDVRRIEVPGGNRYSTAAEVAKEVLAARHSDTAVIAGGFALVDSLVAGPLAHRDGHPILLVGSSHIPTATEEIITGYGIENLVVVGGPAVVSEAVFEALEDMVTGTVERVAGDDAVGQNRYGTSIRFAERFFSECDSAALVNGFSFVDSVAASVLEIPILYIQQDNLREDVREMLQEKKEFKVIGGPVVISERVLEEVREIFARLSFQETVKAFLADFEANFEISDDVTPVQNDEYDFTMIVNSTAEMTTDRALEILGIFEALSVTHVSFEDHGAGEIEISDDINTGITVLQGLGLDVESLDDVLELRGQDFIELGEVEFLAKVDQEDHLAFRQYVTVKFVPDQVTAAFLLNIDYMLIDLHQLDAAEDFHIQKQGIFGFHAKVNPDALADDLRISEIEAVIEMFKDSGITHINGVEVTEDNAIEILQSVGLDVENRAEVLELTGQDLIDLGDFSIEVDVVLEGIGEINGLLLHVYMDAL